MAPKKVAQLASASQAGSGETRSESQSLDASQSQDVGVAKLQDLSSRHQQKVKERRLQQKKEILANHEKRQKRLVSEVEKCLRDHEDTVREIRRSRIESLLELAREKRALEERIEKCQSELDQAFLSTAQQLQVALTGRIEEPTE